MKIEGTMMAPRVSWKIALLFAGASAGLFVPTPGFAAAEIKLDKDFLSGIIEKVPTVPFQKDGQYKGTVRKFRLLAIDAKSRRFEVACQVDGEFRPPMTSPAKAKKSRHEESTEDWTNFRFDVRTGINVEPGRDGAPRFRVEVEEVKRRELEGLAGALAKLLGRSFDQVVTQVADGKASQLGEKINAEILKRVKTFREYGVLCAIDYAPSGVVLHFDVTRLESEGVVGYVYPEPRPGTVALTRWFHPRRGHHLYTITPEGLERQGYVAEGVACYVFASTIEGEGTIPLYRWRSRKEPFYTTAPNGEGVTRAGYRADGIACALYPEEKPETVPLYRFVDPRNGRHFYTMHKYAEFAK
jgi:hypothetical protein